MEDAPPEPQSKRSEVSSRLKERIFVMKSQTVYAKVGERPETTAVSQGTWRMKW